MAAVARHKDILISKPSTAPDTASPLTPAQKSLLVVERAPSFATIASQLKALDDQQLPATDGFVKLAKLRHLAVSDAAEMAADASRAEKKGRRLKR